MQPISEQIQRIDHDKILRARQMTMEERFIAGMQLWSLAKETVRAGIRMQHPNASEDEVEIMVRKRMQQDHER